MGASLPIFEQRFNVTRFVRSLNGSLVITNFRNQGGCDEFSAFDELYSNGLYYFVNVKYDFENKIWKRLGSLILSNFLRDTKLERAVEKNEKLEKFKLESLKLESFLLSWNVPVEIEKFYQLRSFQFHFERS